MLKYAIWLNCNRSAYDVFVSVSRHVGNLSVFIWPCFCRMNAFRRKPIGLHPFETPNLSDSELCVLLSHILLEQGKATVGKLGSLLHSYSSNHNLSNFIKEKYGGLKKFCERHPTIFLLNCDHPYNPTGR
jgi:hypothetical protein